MTEPLIRPLRTSSPTRTAQPIEDLYANASDDTGSQPDRESPPSTPRWVKVFGITAIVLLLLFAGLHLTGKAPSHMPSSGMEHGMQGP